MNSPRVANVLRGKLYKNDVCHLYNDVCHGKRQMTDHDGFNLLSPLDMRDVTPDIRLHQNDYRNNLMSGNSSFVLSFV